MNGFANTALTFLLGWVRTLLNSAWTLLSSEDGSHLMDFMRANWLYLFIALCVGGFLVDRIVYLVRWRPFYVWAAKLDRLRHRDQPYEEEPGYDAPYAPEAYPMREEYPPQGAYPAQEAYPEPYAPPPYAPPAEESPTQVGYPPPAFYPPEPDDEPPQEPAALPRHLNPAKGLAPSFGLVQPEPRDYLEDVQAGFAPAPTPEELYPGPRPALDPQEPDGPVHPGLDKETLQQNIGINQAELDHQHELPQVDFPDTTYVRYYDEAAERPTNKPKSGLSALAQKARSFVGSDDEDVSIRDLQPPVDIRQAFHAPVYPKKYSKGEE